MTKRNSAAPSAAVKEAEQRQLPTVEAPTSRCLKARTGARVLLEQRNDNGVPLCPVAAHTPLRRLYTALDSIAEDYGADERLILERHGARKSGKLIEGADGIALKGDRVAAVLEEIRERQKRVEAVQVRLIKASWFDGLKGIDHAALADLGPFLVDDVVLEDEDEAADES